MATSSVSILVLLDHAGRLQRARLDEAQQHWFRSLFSWIMLGDQSPKRRTKGFSWVSILVLLDHAGRPSAIRDCTIM